MTALLVVLGGALGAVLRFVVDGETKARLAKHPLAAWPVATLLINVLGSFALGALDAAEPGAEILAFCVTGMCGGFTTFSTASVEVLTLLRARGGAAALGYAALSLLLCCAACLGGAALF